MSPKTPKSRGQPKKLGRPRGLKKSVRTPGRSNFMTGYSGAAINTFGRNMTEIEVRACKHSNLGAGWSCSGTQFLCPVTTTASDSQLFSTTGTASSSINQVILNPDILNGRMALIARTFTRYRFRYVAFEYSPLVATSQNGGYSLAYSTDPVLSTVDSLSYSAVQELTPSIKGPFRERGMLEMRYDGDGSWFCEETTEGTATGSRMVNQGVLLGYPSSSSIGAVPQGDLRIRYTIELFCPIPDLGFTVITRSREEAKAAKLAVSALRQKKDESKESKDSIRPVTMERDERSGLRAPPSTPTMSSSTSSTSSGVTSSSLSQGWFRA